MALGLLLAIAPAGAQDREATRSTRASELASLCILPESYEMRPDVFVLIPGAKRIGLTLFRKSDDGLVPYTREELRYSGITWYQCLLQGRKAATEHLKTLKHEIKRDHRKIIQYARFTSDSPLTASILLSPELLKRFEDTLGKELYVTIPDRNNVFVFPKLSESIKAVAPKMAHLYKEALYPVSREVFELSKDGIRVIGKF